MDKAASQQQAHMDEEAASQQQESYESDDNERYMEDLAGTATGTNFQKSRKRIQTPEMYSIDPVEKRSRAITSSISKREMDLTYDYYDYAYFVDINFLKVVNIPKRLEPTNPLVLSKLRPKEVSMLRISGNPHHRHYYINYENDEGRPNVSENDLMAELVHGMSWKTKDNEDLCEFERFFMLFTVAGRYAKLYTMNSLVFYYLTEICKFKNVVKLEKRTIPFDPYIHECDYHARTYQVKIRCCTMNRVWALRHSFSKELTSVL